MKIGGYSITQFISQAGDIVQKALEGYEFQGSQYSATPADLSKKDASQGYIQAGNKRIDVVVDNDLGGLSILHINPDGSFFVEVTELVLNVAFHVDQKVYYYDPAGNLVWMARVPLAEQYVSVLHSLAVGPGGDVYALISRPDGAEIQKLAFNAELPAILIPPEGKGDLEQPDVLPLLTEDCRSREAMINVAWGYVSNNIDISSYHIDDYGACAERVKPRYLNGSGNYDSVPYAWNKADTVRDFNGFMSVDLNGMYAGDIDEPSENCSRGVDCSGLVSNAWDLGDHFGTCLLESVSIPIISREFLRPGDIMNRCSSTPRHTIIFDRFIVNGMWGYEATTEFEHDKVAHITRLFSTLTTYTPRRYINVCRKIYLPMIERKNIEMISNDPYPPPEFPPSPNPYLTPNPYP